MTFAAKTTLRFAAILALSVPAVAYAQGTREQQEACTPDAVKLCSDTIPDIDKTTACMKAHFSQLTPRCQSAFNAATGDSSPARSASRESEPRHRDQATREAPAADGRDASRDDIPPVVAGYPPFPSPEAPIVHVGRVDSARRQIVQACRDGLIDSFTCHHTVPSLFGE